jgi:hypothetical protein
MMAQHSIFAFCSPQEISGSRRYRILRWSSIANRANGGDFAVELDVVAEVFSTAIDVSCATNGGLKTAATKAQPRSLLLPGAEEFNGGLKISTRGEAFWRWPMRWRAPAALPCGRLSGLGATIAGLWMRAGGWFVGGRREWLATCI